MREIKLAINKKVDIEKIITDKFHDMKLPEYYMRKLKKEDETTYFFVYELAYETYKQVTFFMRFPGKIIVSTSILATVRKFDTVVSIVISTDDDERIPNPLLVTLVENGFKIID